MRLEIFILTVAGVFVVASRILSTIIDEMPILAYKLIRRS